LNPFARLDVLGQRVRDTLLGAAKAKGIPLQVPQVGSMFSLFFNAEKVRNYDQAIASNGDQYRKVFRYALDHGVYLAPSPYETAFISSAHEGADIDKACEVLDAAVRSL
jgi:glutamate-1-semialdehyde 2,1-aminomutase